MTGLTDDQLGRLVLSAVFNGPPLALAAIYVRNMRRDHAKARDQVSLRAYLVSIGFLAAIGAYVTLAIALIDSEAVPIDRPYRIAIFAFRVVFTIVLILVTRSYRRQNRVVRERP